jgi:hypothetical protein
MRMMRSWRSPRLLRIALRCSAPTQKEKKPGGTCMKKLRPVLGR